MVAHGVVPLVIGLWGAEDEGAALAPAAAPPPRRKVSIAFDVGAREARASSLEDLTLPPALSTEGPSAPEHVVYIRQESVRGRWWWGGGGATWTSPGCPYGDFRLPP
jgi:hypothetical protein